MKMKNIYVVFFCIILLAPIVSSTTVTNSNGLSNGSSYKMFQGKPCQVKALFTIYKLNGETEHIDGYISVEHLGLFSQKNIELDDIEKVLPEEMKSYLETGIHDEYNKMSEMTVEDAINNFPFLLFLLKKLGVDVTTSLGELSDQPSQNSNLYFNALCMIDGLGAGFPCPPYIPITPFLLLYGNIILETKGIMGHWMYRIGSAICLPFIGISIYVPVFGVVYVHGLSGLTIARY